MAKVKVTIPTGGNLPGESATETTGYSLEITGATAIRIPVQVGSDTYYLVAAPAWAFVDKGDA